MKIGATILTGFLGSGKTTLLNRLLSHPAFAKSAVLVNEFGPIGIDHDLLTYTSERVAVVAGGCICCAVREDIEEAVRHLFEQQALGKIEPFEHLFVETSGLADPVPLVYTFKSSPLLSSRIELKRVVTTIDGVLGLETLSRFPEAVRQVALADTIFIAKTDLWPDYSELSTFESQLQNVNPLAAIMPIWSTDEGKLNDQIVSRLLEEPAEDYSVTYMPVRQHNLIATGISSFSLSWDESLDWTAFGVWLTMLLHRHGPNVLRIKGLLNIQQSKGPVAFHCIQHVVHPPVHMAEWPTNDKRSRVTFILDGLDADLIRRSLLAFNRLANAQHSAGVSTHKALGAGSTIRGRPVRRANAPRWIK